MDTRGEPDDRRETGSGTDPVRKRLTKTVVLHHSPWLVLVFFLLITWTTWQSAADALLQAQHDYFDFRAREATTRIVQRMQAYQQVLLGVQGLYKASVTVERSEFRTYVEGLDLGEHYPGIQGVGFSLIVPAAQKNDHLSAVRGEGFPGYTIHPDGPRDCYTSIIYLEPFSGRNLRAFGYDMYSEPVRRAAMEAARDNGVMALTGKVRLVQESGGQEQAGFLLYLPIYRNGLPHRTVAERRASIVGWAYAPFRMNDLMQGIHGERASDLDIEIYDGTGASAETLMYDSAEHHEVASPAQSTLRSETAIEIAGRRWTIRVGALAGLRRRLDTNRPALIAAGGVVISLLLAWLSWLLVRGRERAIVALREREALIAELQTALAEIKTLQGILPICSVCKKIRDDKDAWNQLETFISERSHAVFSHGYCPDCARKALAEAREYSKNTRTG